MRRLTGGHRGYRDAVDMAFRVNMHNPSVVYSDREGFTVQSRLTPLDSDEFRVAEAYYCLGDGGNANMNGSRREYLNVCVRLSAWLNALESGATRMQADDAACEAEFESEYATSGL